MKKISRWSKIDIVLAVTLFLLVLTLHSRSPVIQTTDSLWALPTAVSIVRDGDLYLGEFKDLIKAKKYYGIQRTRRIEGRKKPTNLFPYGTSLLISPLVLFFESFPSAIPYLIPGTQNIHSETKDLMKVRPEAERFFASVIIALSALLWFLLGTPLVGTGWSLVLTLFFSFGTSAWSTASRGLWQHGPVVLITSLALFCIVHTPKKVSLAGIPLGFGYLIRPTTVVPLGLTTLYLMIVRRRSLLLFLLFASLSAILFLLINTETFHTLIPPYYKPGRVALHPDFLQAISASLVSPNRGMLFLSPFLFTAIPSLLLLIYPSPYRSLTFLCWGTIIFHLILTSLFPNWWHGHCFGSRYMTDILPFFFLLICFVIRECSTSKFRMLLLFLGALSIPIHYIGANNRSVFGWNTTPINVDEDPSRVWSLRDWQVLR